MQKGCLPAKEVSVEMRLLVRPMLGCPIIQGGSSENAEIKKVPLASWYSNMHIYKLPSIDRSSCLVWEHLLSSLTLSLFQSPPLVGGGERDKKTETSTFSQFDFFFFSPLISFTFKAWAQTHFKGFLILVNASPMYLYFRNSLNI